MKHRLIGDRAFYKRVFAVALPIMLQNGITNFVNMLDNIMVGQIGTVQMAGVAIANQLVFVFNLCIFGAISGAGIFTAQFFGLGDTKGVRYTLRFKLMIAALLSLLAIGLFWFFGGDLVNLYLKGDGSVEDAAASLHYGVRYLRIILLGLIPFAVVQSYSGTLRETGETVLPMIAGTIAVLVNLVFNYILIFGKFGAPAMGAAGAAVATVLSRYVELAIVVIWTHRHQKKNPFAVGLYRSLRVPLPLTRQIILKGTPLLLNEALWSMSLAAINQCYSVRGLDVVAATNISSTFWNLFSVCFMAIGTAIAILVGQLLGAGELKEAEETDWKLITVGVGIGIVVGGLFCAFSGLIPLLYNTTHAVRLLATKLMLVGGAMMPVTAFLHAAYFTIRCGGKTLITFFFDCGFMVVVSLPVALVLSRFTAMPIVPMYLCVQLLDFIKCAIAFVMLKKGIWINRIVSKTEE